MYIEKFRRGGSAWNRFISYTTGSLLAITMGAALLLSSSPVRASEGPVVIEPDGVPGPKAYFWLETSLKRIFPTDEPGGSRRLEILAPRNGRVSFQAVVRNWRPHPLGAETTVTGGEGLDVTVRRVGYVPMRHHTTDVDISELDGFGKIPGYCPDPLFPDQRATVAPWETQPFWITVRVPKDAKPGPQDLTVRLTFHGGTQFAELTARINVSEFVVQPRKNFPVTHWWSADGIYEWYKIEPFGDRFFELTKAYLENKRDKFQDVIYVPIFYMRREIVERPSQLLIVNEVEPGEYEFDWSRVKRFVDLAKSVGFDKFEWTHFWIYWGVENPIRVYTQKDGGMRLLWPPDAPATGPVYRNFLSQFLPEFHAFLKAEGILEGSYFHLSDEPHGNEQHIRNYRAARELLRELAPWIKVIDALSDITYGRQGLTDIPIPDVAAAKAYIDEGIPHWVYFCTGPRGPYLNRFFDTPLPKIRMSGWLFYRLGADGFLHWGYNYWHRMESNDLVDPFLDGASGVWPNIPYGDPFVVYPGPNGPIDSIRWEVWAESLQDFAILQTAGISREDPLLSGIKDYANFPKTEAWIQDALQRILTGKTATAGR
jgi:hypothetical protein